MCDIIQKIFILMEDASQTRDFSRELDAFFLLTTFLEHEKINMNKISEGREDIFISRNVPESQDSRLM